MWDGESQAIFGGQPPFIVKKKGRTRLCPVYTDRATMKANGFNRLLRIFAPLYCFKTAGQVSKKTFVHFRRP